MSNDYEFLLVNTRDYVTTICINRPEKHNAMSPQVMAELVAAFVAARANSDARAVVLTGAGERQAVR